MRHLPKHTSSQRIQRGQAMIEYAILFILLTVLFIGGAELGSAALASYKNTDAAKSAVSEYAEINQRRLNILKAGMQYLSVLSSYDSCIRISGSGACDPAGIFSTYTEFLNEEYANLGINGLQDVYDELVLQHITCPTQTGLSVDWDTDNDCEISEEELSKSSLEYDSVAPVGVDEGDRKANGQLKFRALMALKHIELAILPLDPNDNLTSAKLVLANHGDTASVTSITSANCNGNTYDYGLPNRYPYHDSDDDGVYEFNDTQDKWIYLFHPLAINVASCSGEDNTRGDKSRLSILVNGHGKYEDNNNDGIADDPLFVPGLPKLNQATYGLYTRVCVDAQDEYVPCDPEKALKLGKTIERTLLKPPGKICFENGGANADSCQGQPDEVTGFYRWGQSGTSINVADELNAGFRPAFQLDCAFQSNYASSSVFDDTCNTNPSKVRIHTRYRSVFEGFLNFGVQELQSDAAAGLFYNPNNVSRCGGTIIGGAGSEIGYLTSINRNDCNRNGFPTLKPHKDFRGCYEVDVETNQVSACN